ncbi:MAG: DcaP family trimeric outer membrane transporter [Hyphomicrobiales bacterium]|nr:DcaP family trimeric outer membrane transporter [Hyphomicrobiales bacterium]
MKALRTLLLGSAGAAMLFTAGTVAQAADAPEAVKGREPVWRCDTAGFIEYPGSDLCFKIGGYAKAWIGGADEDWTTGEGIDEYGVRDDLHTTDNTFFMGAQGRLNFDIRNATEFGVVRAFIEMWATDNNGNSGGNFTLRHAFIQIGNWLMGKTWSTFRSGPGTPEQHIEVFAAVGDQRTVRAVQIRYTFNVGNGVTINVAIEDPAFMQGGDFEGSHIIDSRNEVPDFVANIQIKGSWGSAQLSGAVHQASGTGFLAPNVNRREVGWATMLSVAIDVPGTMGDVIYLAGAYADGHMGAIDTGAPYSWSDNLPGGSVSISGWAVVGGWEHYWSQTLRSTIAASHANNDYDADFHNVLNIDTATSVWANLVWTIVPQLDLGVEVVWTQNKITGTQAQCIAAGFASCTASAIAVGAQATRSF